MSSLNRASIFRIAAIVLVLTLSFTLYLKLTHQKRLEASLKDTQLILETIPFHQILQKNDPELYNQLSLAIDRSVEQNDSLETLRSKLQSYLEQIVSQRLPTASNKAVIDYMKVTVEELKALKARGNDYCHQFLYPTTDQTVVIGDFIDKDLLIQDREAVKEVIRSSYENPTGLPNEKQAIYHLQHVLTLLALEHGQKLQVLSTPSSPSTNKGTVCTMTIALFQEILKLPESDSGTTLRFLILQNNHQAALSGQR